MKKEYRDKLIKANTKPIIDKVLSGMLYGQPVDANNYYSIILGAYLLGQTEAQERRK